MNSNYSERASKIPIAQKHLAVRRSSDEETWIKTINSTEMVGERKLRRCVQFLPGNEQDKNYPDEW